MNKPKVAVVLPTYNCANTLNEAIQSLLLQSYEDFELIVVDDGSTDSTPDILSRIQDSRLRIITQKNQGIVVALNNGIAAASAPLIARHDADDCSERTRLEKQVAYMQQNGGVVLLGSSIQTMNMVGKILNTHYVLLSDPELKQELLVRSPFAHGSVMFRKDAYEKAGGYQKDDWPAEDYGLWLRMAAHGTFANLDEPLYLYRDNNAGISAHNNSRQIDVANKIRREALRYSQELTPKRMSIVDYNDKPMGAVRAKRIKENLTYELLQALRLFDANIFLRTLCLLIRLQNGPKVDK